MKVGQMKHKKQILLSLVLLHCCLMNADQGNIEDSLDSDTQNENGTSSQDCISSERPYKIELRNIEGRGVGYQEGYSTLEWYYMPTCGNFTPILDLRGHVFNNGKFASNVGIGLRYLNGMIWGVNAYYDFRQTNRTHFNQISVGLEALGRWVDYRINGYFPVGRKHSGYYHTRFDSFKGNNIIIERKREFAMTGANAELGVHILDRKNVDLYGALGPYYFGGEGKNAWGGEARLAATFFNHLRVQASTSYDSTFKWIGQGEVGLNFSFGHKKKIRNLGTRTCSEAQYLAERAGQRIDRNEIIVVDRKHKRSKAINPATGEPYFVLFVDNTSSSDGTFESPYSSLATAETNSKANDVIYIFPGDGTTTGLDTAITLQNGQFLLGSAADVDINSQFGTFTIPAQTYNYPQLTAPANAVIVTPADENLISGLAFLVQGNTGAGVFTLTGGGNSVIVQKSLFVTPSPTTGRGVFLANYVHAKIIGNTFVNGSIGAGGGINAPFTGVANYSIIGNNFIGCRAGAFLVADSGVNKEVISGNNFVGNFVSINAGADTAGSSAIVLISNNVSTGAFSDDVALTANSTSSVCATIRDNIFAKSGRITTSAAATMKLQPLINNGPGTIRTLGTGSVLNVPQGTCD